jgi:hypothetical protein
MIGVAKAPQQPANESGIEALRAQVVVLEASVEGLRREALVEKRRLRAAARERDDRLSAIESSRAYRICLAYYSLFALPLIGMPLWLARAAVARAIRAMHRRG